MLIQEIDLTNIVQEIKRELMDYIDQKIEEYFRQLNTKEFNGVDKLDQFVQFVEDKSYELCKLVDDVIPKVVEEKSAEYGESNLSKIEKKLSECDQEEGGDKIGKYLKVDKEREVFGEISVDSLEYKISDNINFEDLSKYVIVPNGHTYKTLTPIIPIVVKKDKFKYSVVFGHEFVNLAKHLGVEFVTVLCLNDESNINHTTSTLKLTHQNISSLLTLSI